MFISPDQYKTLFGMLNVWKQLPEILIEFISLICVSLFGIVWSIGICVIVAAPISFWKFGLINNAFMLPGTIYANFLKWPVRIGALFLVSQHSHANAGYLIFIFLGGAKLFLLP